MEETALLPQTEAISTLPAPPIDSCDPAEAQAADAELDRLVRVVHEPLVRLAVLIHRIKERALFQPLGYETFEAYISSKQLQFSRSFVFQLAKVGKMLEASGIDPIALPEQSSEITKLAQIARLPDPQERRRVVETGFFEVEDQSRCLRDIPVRELTHVVDRRLGHMPKERSSGLPSQRFERSDDWERSSDEAMPWDETASSRGGEAPRNGGTIESWRRLVVDLRSAISPLDGADRDEAINALSQLYQELVGF